MVLDICAKAQHFGRLFVNDELGLFIITSKKYANFLQMLCSSGWSYLFDRARLP